MLISGYKSSIPAPRKAAEQPSQPENPPNTLPDKVLLRAPLQALGGACVGGLAGALLSSHHLVGAVAGAAVGGLVGNYADILAYDAMVMGRQLKNRLIAERGKWWNKLDQARQPAPPAPLTNEDLRAVAPTGDSERRYDGYDSSRDLYSLHSREGTPDEPYRFQIETAHLRPGAEHGYLDTTLLLDWGQPAPQRAPFGLDTQAGFKLGLKVDNNRDIKNDLGQKVELPLVNYDTTFSHLALGLDKAELRARGWTDGTPLRIEVLTSADKEATVRDRLQANSHVTADAELLRSVFRWEGKTIYYAITDRFSNGNRANDQGVDPDDPNRFHGGDWQGVIDKLDYLEALGVDCVWLSCPYENDRDFLGSDGYHGYWPHDFEAPEPGFGNLAKLKELTDKAHAKGMKVMLDVVVNHTGYNHPNVTDPNFKQWFHNQGDLSWIGQWAMENQALAGLPDLDQENPEVANYLIDVHQRWLTQTGVDAFRMDAVRHVPEQFLRRFNEAMKEKTGNFLSIGEAFWLNPNFVAGYQNRNQESMFDFNLAYAIRNVFSGDPNRSFADRIALSKKVRPHHKTESIRLLKSNGSESMKLLSEALSKDYLYDNPKKLGIFVDNHDMLRFMSDCAGDERKLRIALGFLYACRGIPCLYYGTEVGMDGWGPDNRKDMEWDKNPDLLGFVTGLTQARKVSAALEFGTQKELLVTDDTYALARLRPEEQVVCVFNNSEKSQSIDVPLDEMPMPASTARALVGPQQVTVKDGLLSLTLPPKGFGYYRLT